MKAPKCILVVDDDEHNRDLLEAYLESFEYTCQLARDGLEALNKLNSGTDLVLMDVMMPGMDGFEVVRRIRNQPESSDVPVIMVTVLEGKKERL